MILFVLLILLPQALADEPRNCSIIANFTSIGLSANGTHCFHLSKESSNFADADEKCKTLFLGGSLVRITNNDDNGLISGKLKR